MPFNLISQIQKLAESSQIDKATKGLLDYTWNFCRKTDFHLKAIDLRKEYNLKRTLGHQEINNSEIEYFKGSINSISDGLESFSVDKNLDQETSLLDIKNLKKTFSHRSKSFQFGEVSLTLDKGEILGVVGENGNGKTTFLRLIQEEILKDSGSIDYSYNLSDIDASETYKRKNKTAFIPQRISKWRGTLMENLVYHASIHGAKGKENDAIVEYVIHRMGLTAFQNLNWNQISSGYKLRFELAKMLLWQPNILILDEPLANLDIQATQNLLEDLRHFSDSVTNPIGIVLTSQQLHEVEQIADKILFLKNGKPVYSGSRSEFKSTREFGELELTFTNLTIELSDKISSTDGVKSFRPSGQISRISYDKKVKASVVLQDILKQGAELTYYRDISDSTIQLFND